MLNIRQTTDDGRILYLHIIYETPMFDRVFI